MPGGEPEFRHAQPGSAAAADAAAADATDAAASGHAGPAANGPAATGHPGRAPAGAALAALSLSHYEPLGLAFGEPRMNSAKQSPPHAQAAEIASLRFFAPRNAGTGSTALLRAPVPRLVMR